MRVAIFSLVFIIASNLHAQNLHVRAGVGGNITGTERSVNHTLASMVVFAELGYALTDDIFIRYSLEPGAKINGEVVQTSAPPQRFGANFLLNQYVKAIRYIGSSESKTRAYMGLGYLLHFQRPYNTVLTADDFVLSVERFNQYGHGVGAYLGTDLSRWIIEGSFHYVFSDFNNFGGIKLGYRAWN